MKIVNVLMVQMIFLVSTIFAAVPHGSALKSLTNIPIGAAVKWRLITNDAGYRGALLREFDLATPENELKMTFVEPNYNQFDFTLPDALVNFCQSNAMSVHGHCLVWHGSQTPWLSNQPIGNLESVMNTYIDQVAGRYKGKILVWDVVNEAFNDNGTYRNSLWYQAMGSAFIKKAFVRAHAADPSAKLIYMDYGNEVQNSKSDAILAMLQNLRSQGVSVDGVGFQCHIGGTTVDYQRLKDNFKRFADAGFDIYIGELDVGTGLSSNYGDYALQAIAFEHILNAARHSGKLKAFQTWGITDKYTWRTTEEHPLMFDESYNAKPAYYAVQDILKGSGSFSGTYEIQNASSLKVFNVKFGAVTNNAKIEQYTWGTWSSQKWQVTPVGDGYYKIVNSNSGLALRIESGSSALNANLVQNTWGDMYSQYFRIVPVGSSGQYKIVNRWSSRPLRPLAGSVNDAALIVQDDWLNYLTEYWTLTSVQ